MVRERVLKVVLVVLGLLFLAGVYPLMQPSTPIFAQMMISLYVTLGVFLLLAARSPSAHRSLIAYAGWANLVHGAVMALQVSRHAIPRSDLLGGALPLAIVGAVLIALTPAKRSESSEVRVSAAAA
jgi:hypothetical protein